MRSVVLIIVAAHIAFFTGGLVADDRPAAQNEVSRLEREYADVLALREPRKTRSWSSPKFFVPNPKLRSIRRRRVANTVSTAALVMVHFAARPEDTAEDVVYEFDASGLIAAGLDSSRLQQLPERGRMTPGVWYFLAKGRRTRITPMRWLIRQSQLLLMLSKSCPVLPQSFLVRSSIA